IFFFREDTHVTRNLYRFPHGLMNISMPKYLVNAEGEIQYLGYSDRSRPFLANLLLHQLTGSKLFSHILTPYYLEFTPEDAELTAKLVAGIREEYLKAFPTGKFHL